MNGLSNISYNSTHITPAHQGGPKKVYDCVCSLHLIKNRFFFVIFSFCIPKHTICFKQTFFFMQQKKRYTYLKNLKNLDVKKKF